MSKYINAEKLKAEIERRIAEEEKKYQKANRTQFTVIGKINAFKDLISFIDSFQQKQSEVDYEKDLAEWMEAGPHTCYPWCSIPDAIEITAEHFYKLGLNARKE